MILTLIIFLAFVQYTSSSIRCFTCHQLGFFCSLPLNIDAEDDNTINDITNPRYDSDHVCQSDHYIDNRTGIEKVILRGTKYCKELNAINHRTYCCNTNNCNKWLPFMIRQSFISSNQQQYLPSMILITVSFILQYGYSQ